MPNIRPHNSVTALQCQRRSMVEITASGENVPLHGINWRERWCTLPDSSSDIYNAIYEFDVKSDDVFVVTFPKCGTTWVQEAAWLLLNNLDFERAKCEDLASRSAFMDLRVNAAFDNFPINTVDLASKLESPRLIKSHLPAHLLPTNIWTKKAKIIYCARNPKDVVVSYFHFLRGIGNCQEDTSMDDFVEEFISNEIMYTPFWPSVLDFWRMRNEPNIFFTTYEEMQGDLKSVLERLNTFLERPTLKDNDMIKLLDHLSFQKMKENKRANPTERIKSKYLQVLPDFEFMRRGGVGTFKDELSADNEEKLNQWTARNLEGTNVKLEDLFGAF